MGVICKNSGGAFPDPNMLINQWKFIDI